MLRKATFFSSVATMYILTLGTIGALLYSSHLFGTPVWAAKPHIAAKAPVKLPPKVISGKPIRIVIESHSIDLPVDDGTYDSTSQSWSLSPDHALYATMTAPANDHAGTTFIYGHGTDAVFGRIGLNHPAAGSVAQLYTDNGQVFSYVLKDIRDLTPSDTQLLADTSVGPPQLIVQTCTGTFDEWRTIFTFSFEKVGRA